MLKRSLLPVLLFLIVGNAFACLEHKRDNLTKYLNDIRLNIPEKTQITKYINDANEGAFLELGAGGDSMGLIIDGIDKNKPIKLLVADIDQGVLDSIISRYPSAGKYIDNKDGKSLNVELLNLEATNLSALSSSSIKGINASALAHEVHSYVPPKNGLDQFFLESARVLENGGVLIYRDPVLQDQASSPNILVLKNDLSKLFLTLFIPKFLDTKFTEIKNMYGKSIKPDLGYYSNTKINFFMKNELHSSTMSIKDFINTPSRYIDFSRDISVIAQRRLISEIQRHYVLFLKDVYPTGFIESSDLEEGATLSSITPIRAIKVLETFANNLDLNFYTALDLQGIGKITREFNSLSEFIGRGVKLKSTPSLSTKILESFRENAVDSALFRIKDHMIWLDAKLFMMLYKGKDFGILSKFSLIGANENKFPFDSLDWLRREGEEHYYYLSVDELFDYLYRLSDFYFHSIGKDGMMFCPVDADGGIIVANREIYAEVLERDVAQLDMQGRKQDFVVSKAIVHLKLMPKDEAIKIYTTLVDREPDKYINLGKTLNASISLL